MKLHPACLDAVVTTAPMKSWAGGQNTERPLLDTPMGVDTVGAAATESTPVPDIWLVLKKKASNFHGCVWKLELPANSANAMSLNDHVCGFNEWSVEFRAADVDVLRNETCMFLGVFLLQKQYQCGLSHIVTCLWFPTAWFNVRHFSLILMISSNSPFRKKLLADIINDQSQPHSTSLSCAILYWIHLQLLLHPK